MNELESYVAELLGKEKALFVPSGTQGNVVSLAAHGQRGDEVCLMTNVVSTANSGVLYQVIVGRYSHIFLPG